MNKTLYIAYISLLLLLTGCYDFAYINEHLMVGELTTLPYEIEGSEILLKGRSTNLGSNYLRFEVSKDKDFSESLVYQCTANDEKIYAAKIDTAVFLSPRYYYRLIAINRPDTIMAPEIESFSFQQTIRMNEPKNISKDRVELSCNCSSLVKNGYFMVATDPEFKEYDKLNFTYKIENSEYNYQTTLTKLVPNTTYYVKLYLYNVLGHIESDVVSFTTEDNTVQSVTISGTGIDGKPIKDNLMVVIKNYRTQEWTEAYTAVYDENKEKYVIEDFTFDMDDDIPYCAYAVSGETRWWKDKGIVNFSQDDYHVGYKQTPIYLGYCEYFSSEFTEINISLRAWTCRLTVAYPAKWGKISNVELYDDKKDLPSSSFYIESQKCASLTAWYNGVSDQGCVLSDDGTKYLYTFNIFPATLTEYCTLTLPLETGRKTFKCPDLRLQSGDEYVITINETDLEVSDVSLKPWEENYGGTINIDPKN